MWLMFQCSLGESQEFAHYCCMEGFCRRPVDRMKDIDELSIGKNLGGIDQPETKSVWCCMDAKVADEELAVENKTGESD